MSVVGTRAYVADDFSGLYAYQRAAVSRRDLATAAELAGHASPNTTKRYDRRGERARHAAAEAIVVPYVGRPFD